MEEETLALSPVKGLPISFEGIPEVQNFSDDSFERVAYIEEGFSGVEFCDADNKLVDCIIACGGLG